MANAKATDIVGLRKVFAEREAGTEEAFTDLLDPELLRLYRTVVSTSWVPVQQHAKIYRAAARVLVPGEREPLVRIGEILARKSYTGVYKIFLRIPTVKFVMGRAAGIWTTYYDTGRASISSPAAKRIVFVVEDFPDLPPELRDTASGHMHVLLEMTGCKNAQVRCDASDPRALKWTLIWD